MTSVLQCSADAEHTIRAIPLELRRASMRSLGDGIDETSTPCNVAGADPELWFPPEGETPRSASPALTLRMRELAAKLCRRCPVQAMCLERSLRDGPEQWGIAGGMSKGDREAAYPLWSELDPALDDELTDEPTGHDDRAGRTTGRGASGDVAA